MALMHDDHDPHPIKIDLEGIESSTLAAIGYDFERHILAVQFKTGKLYHYGSVPPIVAAEFYGAPSRGRFYSHHIRGRFPGRLMTGECPKCGDLGFDGDPCADCGCASYAVPAMKALEAER